MNGILMATTIIDVMLSGDGRHFLLNRKVMRLGLVIVVITVVVGAFVGVE